MLTEAQIDALARAYQSERRRTSAPSALHLGLTVDDAYAVQRRWVEPKVAEGVPVRGCKIALISPAMQRQANIAEPDYGALLVDVRTHRNRFADAAAAQEEAPIVADRFLAAGSI